jgi:hypothetical protein
MGDGEIQTYANQRGFQRNTLDRWLNWAATDREALATLALSLKISENHLREMMDWLEEIALRDDKTIQAILAEKPIYDANTDPRLGRADRLKRIKEQLRRRRFPRLAETEDQIHKHINALKLQPEIRLSVTPGLEGGQLNVEFEAGTTAEFKAAVRKLGEATSLRSFSAIFELLSGNSGKEQC